MRLLVVAFLVAACSAPARTPHPAGDPLARSTQLRLVADWDGARRVLETALATARGPTRAALLVERAAVAREASSYQRDDNFAAARASLAEAEPLLASAGPATRAAFAEEHGWITYWRAFAGEATFADARVHFERGRALRVPDDRELATTWFAIGLTYQQAEQLAEARTAFVRGMELAERHADLVAQGYLTRHLGYVEGELAKSPALARPYYERSLALRERAGHRWGVVFAALLLAETTAEAGDRARARPYAERALALADELRLGRGVAAAHELLATFALADGATAKACEHLAHARDAWTAYGDAEAAAAAIARCPGTPATSAAPAAASAPAAPEDAISVRVAPAPAYVELADHGQLVNCDLIVANTAAVAWQLEQLQVEVFDRHGALALRKFVDGNGVSPSILTIPNRELAANATALILNPLHAYPRDVELANLRFTLTYARTDGSRQRVTAATEVAPVVYANRARLRLPVRGRVLVWDGHDFLAHHRRWDYVFAPIRGLGFTSNAGRYSYDLVHVDATGAMTKGDPADNASWYAFGQPIYAPAAGTVVAVVDTRADDRTLDMDLLKTELLAVYGNYVIVDHGHGEHSVFGHIRQGSAKVKVGERVRAGQVVAAIGASGSSLMPHLHYQLQTTATAAAEGLPSYFHDFVRVRGRARVRVPRGPIESGDIIESATRAK